MVGQQTHSSLLPRQYPIGILNACGLRDKYQCDGNLTLKSNLKGTHAFQTIMHQHGGLHI